MTSSLSGFSIDRDLDDAITKLPKTKKTMVVINYGNHVSNNEIHFGGGNEDQMERKFKYTNKKKRTVYVTPYNSLKKIRSN